MSVQVLGREMVAALRESGGEPGWWLMGPRAEEAIVAELDMAHRGADLREWLGYPVVVMEELGDQVALRSDVPVRRDWDTRGKP